MAKDRRIEAVLSLPSGEFLGKVRPRVAEGMAQCGIPTPRPRV